ncbi:hypothetical protein TSUD_375010 [Trifolium subterraneum]|uniref:Uncharacterized protein n=1 Tax=Trifolium subterraneum TaxID=3900 RepID=A0A2Z6NDU8_TRISU|nr:hypothetical protein TSUD_375010 [Trifolium subterraneum]
MPYLALMLEWLKNQYSNLIGTHEGKKQNEEHEAEFQQAHEIQGDIQIDDPVMQQVTTNDLDGVSLINEELDQEEEETNDHFCSVPDTQLALMKQADAVEVEKCFTSIDIAASVVNNFDASARAIPDTTQKLVILPDDEFNEVVRADL